MLVLSRKEGQRIVIGRDIVVTVLGNSGNRVRLGISAPQQTSIRREELLHKRRSPVDAQADPLDKLQVVAENN